MVTLRESNAMAYQDKLKPIAATSKSYLSKLKPIKTGPFKYDVEYSTQEKVAKAQKEADAAKKESKKASSVGGFLKNFGRAFVDNATIGTSKLGDTLGGILSTNATVDSFSKTSETNSKTLLAYQKLIKEKEAKGEDTSSLKKQYNQIVEDVGKNQEDFSKITAPTQKSNLQVGGEILGTAVDALSFGTYGKAFPKGSFLSKFKPQSARPSILPKGNFLSKATLGTVAEGGALGYGFDVSSGLQGERGEEKEGSGAFKPGVGTALGIGFPLALRGAEGGLNTVRGVYNKAKQLTDIEAGIAKEVDSLFKQTRGIENKVKLAEQKNVNLREIISDPTVFKGVKIEKGAINPDEAIAVFDTRIDTVLDAKNKLLPEIDKFVPKTSREALIKEAIEGIRGTVSPADEADLINAINKQIDALPEELSLVEMDSLRARFRQSARDARGLQKRASEYSALENTFRDKVFAITDDLPFDTNGEFAALNTYVRDMIEAKTFLDKTLRGQKVKGGRLGTYVGRLLGGFAGSQAGIFGTILGSEVGGTIAKILQNNQLGSSMKMKLIRNITDDPKILKEVDNLLKGVSEYNPLLTPTLPPGAIPLGPKTGQSSVQLLPAPLGEPGRTPAGQSGGGQFFRTFQSTPEKTPPTSFNSGAVRQTASAKGIVAWSPYDAEILVESKYVKTKSQLTDIRNKTAQGALGSVTPQSSESVISNHILEAKAQNKSVIIDPDVFKGKFGDYDPANHEKYSAMAKEAFSRALKEVTNLTVKFTAGGSGSGKSELVLKRISDGFNGIVVDGTMSNYSSAIKKFNEVKNSGKKVEINAILPRIESAWKFVQKRALRTGRNVPLDAFVEAHVGFVETMKKLVSEGYEVRLKDTRNIFTTDEARNAPFLTDSETILALLDEVRYNRDELLRSLKNIKYGE